MLQFTDAQVCPLGGMSKKIDQELFLPPVFFVVMSMLVIIEHIFIGFMAIVPFETGIC